MSTLFLIICGVAVVFYAVFLFECSRPVRKSWKGPVVRKSTETAVVDSATGRRFLVHLEQQMAEFLSAHRRAAAMLLIGMLLISIPIAAQGPRAQPAVPPSSDTDQQISPAVQKQLDACKRATRPCKSALSSWRRS